MTTLILTHYASPDGARFARVERREEPGGGLVYVYQGDDAPEHFGAAEVVFGEAPRCDDGAALSWVGEVIHNRGGMQHVAGEQAPQPSYAPEPGAPVRPMADPTEPPTPEADGAGPWKGLLVTGKTYENRRYLRGLAGRFDRDLGGYVCPLSTAKVLSMVDTAGMGLRVAEVDDLDYDPAVPETDEQRRERRMEARLRRADRLERQAANRDRDARAARARHRPYTSDYSFITQPILIGHHSQRRHERLWDRIDAARDAEMRNSIEADELRARAERLRVELPRKGDAERRRQAARDAAEASGIRKGSIIKDVVFGQGRVTSVNQHTYTVAFDRGFSQKVDKSHAVLIRQDDTPAPPPAFKKGDRVMAVVFLGHGRARPATVQRKTPRGYSVLVDGDTETRTLPESQLSAMPAEPAVPA